MCILLLALLALGMSLADFFEELRQQWAQDLHDKRIEASLALYTPDGVFTQPDGARVKGAAAIQKLYRKVTSTFDSTLKFSSERVQTCGNLAYDSSTYIETLTTRCNTGSATRMRCIQPRRRAASNPNGSVADRQGRED